jgi:hypothetical protein
VNGDGKMARGVRHHVLGSALSTAGGTPEALKVGFIIAGRFDLFWGPIKDQSGKLHIAAGEKLAEEVLLGMNWFVEGVVGTVPK